MLQTFADLMLLLVTMIWGTTFVIVKDTIVSMRPLTFLAVRFFIAGVVLLIWLAARKLWQRSAGKHGRPENPRRPADGPACLRALYIGGTLTGIFLLFSYVTQTLGLVTVSAGKAAFITGLYVVMVPIASQFMSGSRPDLPSSVGVFLATVGLGLMSLKLPFEVAPGDFLVFLCAVGFAVQILLVDAYSPHVDPVAFAAVQLLVVAAGAFLAALVLEWPLYVPDHAWGAILFTAIPATSIAFLVQTAMQRYTSPTHAALIFSAEPVFGALFAWLWAGEVLSLREIAGAVFIVLGMVASEADLLNLVFTRPRVGSGNARS